MVENDSRNSATEKLTHILKNVVIFVIPVSIVSSAVDYLFHNQLYTGIAVAVSVLILYLAWLELRLRNVEAKAYEKKN